MPQRPIIVPAALLAAQSLAQHPFLRLPHPRTLAPSLYLHVPSAAAGLGCLYELQRVGDVPDETRRSWFIQRPDGQGDHIVSDGRLMILTPCDPMFLVLSLLLSIPALAPLQSAPESGYFRSIDDLLDQALQTWSFSSSPSPPPYANQQDRETFIMLSLVKATVSRLCDKKTPGHGKHAEPLWRVSKEKVVKELDIKMARISAHVVMSGTDVLGRMAAKEQVPDAPSALVDELKQSVAMDVLAGYLSPAMVEFYRARHPLPLLTVHRAHVVAQSKLVTMSASYLPGRTSSTSLLLEEGKLSKNGKSLTAATKKGSRGVEALKKVNTRGMKKLDVIFAMPAQHILQKSDNEIVKVVTQEAVDNINTSPRRSPRKRAKLT